MRPLRLILKGFTSFSDETTVSFEELDRFAICGPTGAGKSSLLDALTFALFADAPRRGSGKVVELMSLGRKSLSVVLDFRVGEQKYRVARVRRRSGAVQDQLDKLFDDGSTELVASGQREVNKEIERLLGLNYAHFTQAVFLPQGKFAEFLRATSAERRDLLNELLRLLVYERMQEKATHEKQRLAAHKEQTERRLREDFAGVTPEILANLCSRHEVQQTLFEQSERCLPDLEARRDAARADHTRTVELTAKQKDIASLQAQQPEIEKVRGEEEAAARASSVMPLLAQADEAANQVRSRQSRLTQATQIVATRNADHTEAHAVLELVLLEAAAVPGLRDRVTRLAEAQGKVKWRDQLSDRLKDHRKRRKELESARANAAGRLQQFGSELEDLAIQLQKAEANQAAISYDADRHQRLETEREAAVRLQAERSQLAIALQRAADSEKVSETARCDAERASAEAEQADAARAQAQEAKDHVEQQVRAAEQADAAAHLRTGLEIGQPCPVCRQPVVDMPRDEQVPALERLNRDLNTAQKQLQRAEKAASNKGQTVAAATAMATASRKTLDANQADASQREQTLIEQEQRLSDLVGGLLAGTVDGPIEDRVLQAVRAAAACAASFQKAKEQLSELREHQRNSERVRVTYEADVERLVNELNAVGDQVMHDESEFAAVREEIRAAAGTEDPVGTMQQVNADIERLEKQKHEAEQEDRETSNALEVASNEMATCVREAEDAAAQLKAVLDQVSEALQQSLFIDAAAARSAARTPAELRLLQGRVQNHEAALRVSTSRVLELESELQGRRVSAEDRQSAERAHESCAKRRQDAQTQAALLARQSEDLRQRLERVRELRQELTEHSGHLTIYDQLARDLRSDHFFAYLLEETLTALVHDASSQLARLTGDRYGLQFDEDRIFVIDHDNAGECRPVDTLSGGETFLASLALALALSEQVQRLAGAVHLDCLFIDEGFGTLDPETLRTVSDTIRGLQVGGRMVGIVTHVPELREEFDQRLIVHKEGGSSRVQTSVA